MDQTKEVQEREVTTPEVNQAEVDRPEVNKAEVDKPEVHKPEVEFDKPEEETLIPQSRDSDASSVIRMGLEQKDEDDDGDGGRGLTGLTFGLRDNPPLSIIIVYAVQVCTSVIHFIQHFSGVLFSESALFHC